MSWRHLAVNHTTQLHALAFNFFRALGPTEIDHLHFYCNSYIPICPFTLTHNWVFVPTCFFIL